MITFFLLLIENRTFREKIMKCVLFPSENRNLNTITLMLLFCLQIAEDYNTCETKHIKNGHG